MRFRLAVVAVLCLIVAGCTDTVAGTAGTQVGATSTTPPPTTPKVPEKLPPAQAGKLLLKRSELGAIVGDTDMTESLSYTEQQTTADVDPLNCTSRVLAGSASAYGNSWVQGMEGNDNSGSAGTLVSQVIAVFENDTSVAFMDDVSQDWGTRCPEGTRVTLSAGAVSQSWTAGRLDPPRDSWTKHVEIERLSTATRRSDPSPRTCGSVIARRDNVTVDSLVCGPDDAAIAQAGTIVDRILAKLP